MNSRQSLIANLSNPLLKNIFVWFLAIAPIFFLYHQLIFNPNTILLDSEGDGIKNYYTYKYYIHNSTSWTDFDGMNYPYGEIVTYLDSQPPISILIKMVSKVFPNIVNYDVGIMHYLILLSFVFSIFLFYKIFALLKVNFLFSILGAWLIVLMSPQFMRLFGHYSLSYMFMYPLIIYLLLQANRRKTNNIIILFIILFSFFLHPYIGLSLFAFVGLVGFIQWIAYKYYPWKKLIGDFIVRGVLPISIFLIVTFLLDHHVNRSNNPSGLTYYHSYLKTIFVASFEPSKSFYKSFISFHDQPFEGIAYIGFASNIIVLLSVFWYAFKRKFYISKEVRILVLASFFLLLFSFGIPHVYPFPKLLDLLPSLRQFRGLGRFSWFFYYVINIVTVVTLFEIYSNSKGKKFVKILPVLLLLIFCGEAYYHQKGLNISRLKVNNEFNLEIGKEYSSAIANVTAKDFQAILPLPFYHVGSEDFAVEGSSQSVKNSMLLSYHLGMPILGSLGSRTSVDESKKALSILLPKYFEKTIAEDIKSRKDFLVMASSGEMSEEESFLVSEAKLIHTGNSFSLYSLPFARLFEYHKHRETLLATFSSLNNLRHLKNGYVVSDTSKYFRVEDYDTEQKDISYIGGAKVLDKKASTSFFEIPEGELEAGKEYELSLWTYNKGYGRASFQIIWAEYDVVAGKGNWKYSTDGRFSEKIDGDWSLIQFKFTPPNNKTSYKIYIPGRDNGVEKIYLDNIILKEASLDIYRLLPQENGTKKLLHNNFAIDVN